MLVWGHLEKKKNQNSLFLIILLQWVFQLAFTKGKAIGCTMTDSTSFSAFGQGRHIPSRFLWLGFANFVELQKAFPLSVVADSHLTAFVCFLRSVLSIPFAFYPFYHALIDTSRLVRMGDHATFQLAIVRAWAYSQPIWELIRQVPHSMQIAQCTLY